LARLAVEEAQVPPTSSRSWVWPSWRALRAGAWELLAPQRCIACGGFGAALHLDCLRALPAAGGERCERCWAPLRPGGGCGRCAAAPPAFAALRTPFVYTGHARAAVLEAKFGGRSALLEPLGVAAARAVPAEWRAAAVAWVPLHPRRRRRRGYDQARELARVVARELELPPVGGLRRVRSTPAQARLDAALRRANVAGAFAAERVAGTVLLVDDVTTTGATLDAAARALLAGGAAQVFALAVARED
jgi:predicted amidophosphoribosyltransferase